MHSVTEFSRPIATALVAIVLVAHALHTKHAAEALLQMEPTELWRLVLEAHRQDRAVFENLPIGMHVRLGTGDSQGIRLALELGSLHVITHRLAPRKDA